MILGFALVLTLLQVGVSFAVPLNQADLNDLEQSVDKLQNFFHEVHATNQREFASQQHPHRSPATNARLQATSKFMYIQDRNSGLVLQYKPHSQYEVVIEHYDPANTYQQWYAIESGFPEYFYITNSTDEQSMRVVAGGHTLEDPLFLAPMSSDLDFSQLWIFRQPDAISNNPRFVIMSAYTGLVWNVHAANKFPGNYVQVWNNVYQAPAEQFYFFRPMDTQVV